MTNIEQRFLFQPGLIHAFVWFLPASKDKSYTILQVTLFIVKVLYKI